MSRFVVTTVVGLTVTAGGLAAQPPARPAGQTPAPPVPWANKLFLPDIGTKPDQPPPVSVEHDFGTVPRGTVLSHTFTLTNIYDVPLQVIDIRRSCGCLEADPPQRVLQPLESAAFTVTMDTGKFAGRNVQNVYVTVGPQHFSTAILRIVADSRADVTLGAPGAIDFGTAAAGTTPTKSVTVEYTGKLRDWKLTGVAPPAGPFAVAVAPAGRNKFAVTATLKADAPPGPFAETVSLATTDPAAPAVPVAVRGVVQPPVQASPDKVDFGRVRVGETVVMTVRVRGNGVGPFKVEPAVDDGDGVTVETLGTKSPVHPVTVKFAPTRPGTFHKDVVVKTTAAGGQTVTVTLDAVVEEAAGGLLPGAGGK